jgi:hypothetical protein
MYSLVAGVDQEFEKLMNTIFGSETMDEFKMKRPAGYVDLMIAFEARKRTASPFKNNPLNISLPFSFIDFYKKKKVNSMAKIDFKTFSFLSNLCNACSSTKIYSPSSCLLVMNRMIIFCSLFFLPKHIESRKLSPLK